jgi:hypothetical protein
MISKMACSLKFSTQYQLQVSIRSLKFSRNKILSKDVILFGASQQRDMTSQKKKKKKNTKKNINNYGMDWINLAQDREQWRGSCEHGNEPSVSIKCWEVLE